jgi:phage-related protein
MNKERTVIAYKQYFADFMMSIGKAEASKISYVLDMLKTQQRISKKFVRTIREELYEIRAEYNGNIFRVFFIFDDGNIVILFNGFQKKTQKMPNNEIEKALKLKDEYYEAKRNK